MKILDVPMSGSANWRTASRNRNGQYLRNRSIPVQPRSTAQLAIRGFLALCAQTWKTLSKADQAAWATYGNNHPKTDSLGQSSPLSGEQAYCSVNSFRLLNSLAQVDVPPVDPDFSAFVEGAVTSADGSIEVATYTRPTDGQIAFYASRPVSAGINFFGKGVFLKSSTGALTTPITLETEIAARFGTIADGAVIQITQVPWVNGIKGAPQTSEVTFAAAS